MKQYVEIFNKEKNILHVKNAASSGEGRGGEMTFHSSHILMDHLDFNHVYVLPLKKDSRQSH